MMLIMRALKALKTNILVNHPSYLKIITQYNEELKRRGKVNDKRFLEEVIATEIPHYSLMSWYQFLRRFKTNAGIIASETLSATSDVPTADANLAKTLLSNQAATASFIQAALNIGADRAKMILENPALLTAKEALDLSIRAMKAQDSRIHAVGKIREDNREQERFDKAFDNSAYE